MGRVAWEGLCLYEEQELSTLYACDTCIVVSVAGLPGATGVTGQRGDVGNPGQAGAVGWTGATGPQGFTGGTGTPGRTPVFESTFCTVYMGFRTRPSLSRVYHFVTLSIIADPVQSIPSTYGSNSIQSILDVHSLHPIQPSP